MTVSEIVGTAVISALSAGGATALTMLAGWWQLRKTEAYRRASRWEPMAERLWQERFNVYEPMLSAFDANAGAIRHSSIEDYDKSNRAIAASHRRLQVFGGARVVQLSGIVMRVNLDLLKFAETNGIDALSRGHFDALTQAISDIETAMRIDLGIQVLDSHSDERFQRTKGEVFHEEWRKVLWQNMSQIERDPPPDAP
jgi:hypothetical protein